MENFRELETKLKEPFSPEDIEWRVQNSGNSNGKHWALVLAYVTNRAIMDRLDEVFGIEGWSNEYKEAPDGGILCGITVHAREVPITKWDGADKTNIEATKGGLSNAMKRCAVQWGIGRYLYNLEANIVTMSELKPPVMKGYGMHYDKDSRKRLYWRHPELPEFAQPSSTK
jgi:hypothetical protein